MITMLPKLNAQPHMDALTFKLPPNTEPFYKSPLTLVRMVRFVGYDSFVLLYCV